MTEQLWRMRCQRCQKPIVLPRRNPTGTPELLRDQPTGTWSLSIICRHCERRFDYTAGNVRLESVELPDQGLPIDVLWRGVFECAHENCRRRIEAYASAEHFLPPNEIRLFLLNATQPATCPQGHLVPPVAVGVPSIVKRLPDW
jgi:hypothetical protein